MGAMGVYQVTYLDDGRRVLIGKWIFVIETAAKFRCPQGHPLRVMYREMPGTDVRWWLACQEGITRWVSMCEMTAHPRETRQVLITRAAKSLNAAPHTLIQATGHHVEPFPTVMDGERALRLEAQAAESMKWLEEGLCRSKG